MTVNEKIAELLDWSNMSQAQLAEKVGMTRANISAYVTGRAAVSVEAAYRIAAALGVSPWTVLNCTPLPVTPLDLSPQEEELVAGIRGLTDHQREVVVQSVALMNRQNREKL